MTERESSRQSIANEPDCFFGTFEFLGRSSPSDMQANLTRDTIIDFFL